MLSSKTLHRLGAAKHTPNGTNNGLSAVSSSSTVTSAQSTQETNNVKYPCLGDPPHLYKALIGAQRTTIGGLQLDLSEARAKIDKLKEKCAAAAVLVARQADFDRLQAESKAGYQAGVEHGMTNVSHCIELLLYYKWRRFCGFGKTL